jgi:hypothetical protein
MDGLFEIHQKIALSNIGYDLTCIDEEQALFVAHSLNRYAMEMCDG